MADGKIRQARAERDEARRDLDRLRAKLKRLGDFYQPELDRLRAALREKGEQIELAATEGRYVAEESYEWLKEINAALGERSENDPQDLEDAREQRIVEQHPSGRRFA